MSDGVYHVVMSNAFGDGFLFGLGAMFAVLLFLLLFGSFLK